MDVTRIRKKAVQKDKLQEGIRPDRLGPFLFWRCFRVHLPRQSEGQGHPVAVAAAGRSRHRGGLSALCIGAGPDGDHAPLVGTVLYAFLAIQVEGSSVLDFLRRAACFLFLQQQYYEWGQNDA